MTDYSSISLVDDNMFIVNERCFCRRTSEWCGECFDGYRAGGCVDLNPVLHGIATAAALVLAFRLGDAYGWDMANDEDQTTDAWRPNVEGRSI